MSRRKFYQYNVPLDCVRTISFVTCSYLITRLHFVISSPSSATEVATINLCRPSLKYSKTSFCSCFVIPKRHETFHFFETIMQHKLNSSLCNSICFILYMFQYDNFKCIKPSHGNMSVTITKNHEIPEKLISNPLKETK